MAKNTQAISQELTVDEAFGPKVPLPISSKKDDVRDYVRTPEVNEILSQHSSKSQAIRALHEAGMSRGAIADKLRIRYQHVNNVLNQKLKRK